MKRFVGVLFVLLLVFTLLAFPDAVRAASFTVTNTNDIGLGSLRQAILDANANPGTDTITFNIPSPGPHTIQPNSALPTITDLVIIDGYTQPGSSSNTNGPGLGINALLMIELDGSMAGAGANGLHITGGNSAVRGLVINRFSSSPGVWASGIGILLDTNGGNVIEGNFIGTDIYGTADLGNDFMGVAIAGVTDNTIGGTTAESRNIISGNGEAGIIIYSPATGNVVLGNFIGTDVNGTANLGNGRWGVAILFLGASNNLIGGTTPEARNVISGNDGDGVYLQAVTDNLIQGNYIGTDVSGTTDLGNSATGIFFHGANNNTIGGTTVGTGNVISGNGIHGIEIIESSGNVVQGNYIGTDVTGTADLGNSADGVYVGGGSTNNTIGGTTPGAGNLISGNEGNGIEIFDSSTENLVQGNFIGTDVTGTAALGNVGSGVRIDGMHSTASSNTIGGTESGAGNIVADNYIGVILVKARWNVIQGNFIGTDVTGTVDLGNRADGVRIFNALFNTVGGTEPGARNVISGNDECGVSIISGGISNVVQGNFIGTDVTGTVDLGNSLSGVIINERDNTIGGSTAEARNVISGNDGCGVEIIWQSGNRVQGNFIGTDVTGVAPLGNNSHGVLIQASEGNNTIGGTADEGNTIAFNRGDGVFVETGTNHAILSNSILSNTGLAIDLNPDEVTPNDAGDSDTGANNLQNFPILTSATSGSSITIEGTLNSTPDTVFRLEFFSNTAFDPTGYGEGENFLGSTDVTTDGSGNVSFVATFPDTVPAGQFITSTATDPNNNTSEFSEYVQVTSAVQPAEATINFDPDTLNLKSKGKVVTVYIELPEGYDVEEIDISSVMLNGIVPALAHPTEVGDYDSDGVPDLMVKFDRAHVQEVLDLGDEVEVTVSGQLTDGTSFEGTDTIRVIERGKK